MNEHGYEDATIYMRVPSVRKVIEKQRKGEFFFAPKHTAKLYGSFFGVLTGIGMLASMLIAF